MFKQIFLIEQIPKTKQILELSSSLSPDIDQDETNLLSQTSNFAAKNISNSISENECEVRAEDIAAKCASGENIETVSFIQTLYIYVFIKNYIYLSEILLYLINIIIFFTVSQN